MGNKILIICISNYCSGREVLTDNLVNVNQSWLIEQLLPIDDNSGPEMVASLFEGTLEGMEQAKSAREHSSHYLSEHCEELCLGDYVG